MNRAVIICSFLAIKAAVTVACGLALLADMGML